MSRRIEDLHPVVAEKCRHFLKVCKARGLNVIVTSTLRTEAEQLALFAQGRKRLKAVNELRKEAGLPAITESRNRIVTHALTSIHQFGCAFDVCITKDGKAVWDVKADINENDIPDYEETGHTGEAIGLSWGGRFGYPDYVHFQYTGGLTLDDLKAGKRPDNPARVDRNVSSSVIPAEAGIQGQGGIDSCLHRNDNNKTGRYSMLSGKKTYIVGIAMILYSITGAVAGKHDFNTGFQLVMQGLGFIGLRLGMAKI